MLLAKNQLIQMPNAKLTLRFFVCLAIANFGGHAFAQDNIDSTKATAVDEDKPLDYWVSQLGHDQYLRRERAMRRLVAAGTDAVPALIRAVRKGDLETTTRAINVLTDLALEQSPMDELGAWGELNKIAKESTGSRQAMAMGTIDEIRTAREEQAVDALADAGVFIGFDQIVLGALPKDVFMLRIDKRWNGDLKTLHWLRWIRGISFVGLSDIGVDPNVLSEVVLMKDLRTLSMVNGDLSLESAKMLEKLSRIDTLEFRYVEIVPEVMDVIAKLPIREGLNIMGTGVPEERVAKLQSELPGLSILFRRGGFLGVTCNTFGVTNCEITTVLPGSAAKEAGLQPRDIVIEIDGEKIHKFADLQAVINKHVPTDSLKMKYMRYGQERSTTVKLGRQGEQ